MTDFGKGEAGIDAVAKKAEAKGFERLCQSDGGSLNAPGHDILNSPWASNVELKSSKITRTTEKLVCRTE